MALVGLLPSAATGRTSRVGLPFRHFADQPPAPFGSQVSTAIVNYNRASPNIGTAGLLKDGGLNEAMALGFKTIIDLRGGSEAGVTEEEAEAEELGIRRYHVPVTTRRIAQTLLDRFAAIIEEPAYYPILAHCVSANRASAMWALYRAGRSVDPIVAIEEARAGGLTSREATVRDMLSLPPA